LAAPRQKASRFLVYDCGNLLNNISAIAASGALEQVANCCPDRRLGVVFSAKTLRNSSDMTAPLIRYAPARS
jgi:hypothetical protein